MSERSLRYARREAGGHRTQTALPQDLVDHVVTFVQPATLARVALLSKPWRNTAADRLGKLGATRPDHSPMHLLARRMTLVCLDSLDDVTAAALSAGAFALYERVDQLCVTVDSDEALTRLQASVCSHRSGVRCLFLGVGASVTDDALEGFGRAVSRGCGGAQGKLETLGLFLATPAGAAQRGHVPALLSGALDQAGVCHRSRHSAGAGWALVTTVSTFWPGAPRPCRTYTWEAGVPGAVCLLGPLTPCDA